MARKLLFIDRDGTLIREPADHQVDAFDKIRFLPGVFAWLSRIAAELDYELVLVSNQDGLGTAAFPQEKFRPVHDLVIKLLADQGIVFRAEHIDHTFARDNAPTRKPNTGMLTEYSGADYDLPASFVIGDRITDVMLAKNLGTKAIWLNDGSGLGASELDLTPEALQPVIALETDSWEKIYAFLKLGNRTVSHTRKTKETDISVIVGLDGKGTARIDTGLGFFDHMLEQIARHGSIDLDIRVKGDLHIDEHHTIEDVGISLGEAMAEALGDKRGIERYGFCLPMDDCLAQVAVDFGGRSWIVWEAAFKREKIGEMPTEMFFHFFKSFSDGARCNLNIKAEGQNEHHKIEAIFKAFARAIRMAVRRDPLNDALPSTKGTL
ncbi:bifunctional histidinol-phosphatase/imidazoleglycerol-phosphate dehydratase HisB [Compostibacter hankyongensis]|uniref:Histidine biosynthesis bifunctional protein HisB n=1 Tax=Compostibacter hankyongensis TaxID=1007089 RepID=A0ABP8FXV4_9BACT